MSASPLRVESVSHRLGGRDVLHELSLEVGPREFVAVVGPSGCGKTTLLNLLSGTYQPTSGRVSRSGRTRMVYQKDGLFPWLTVSENIAMGLESRDAAERRRQLAELVSLIHLDGFEGSYPHQLSGGMRQRVELARALAGQSEVLLMDEPFSALDYQTRLRMRGELVRILHERPRAVVFVTHDIEEAAQLADRVLVLTARPARVCCELRIDAPRPRPLTHPSVLEAAERILRSLGLEEETRAPVAVGV